jgi:hypothetical protein
MDDVSAAAFSFAARALAAEARRQGLAAPGFRSPPRVAGAARTIRWRPDGVPVVAVRRRGRRPPEVLADMVEGVLVANGLSGPEADARRPSLAAALAEAS